MKKIALLLVAIMAFSAFVSAGAVVVRDPVILHDGNEYRTVVTPKTLPSKIPDHAMDRLYVFFDPDGLQIGADSPYSGQRMVSDSAPGQRDYNGGKWQVIPVTFTAAGIAAHDPDNDQVLDIELTSDAMIMYHAVSLGHLVVGEEATRFVCPVIKYKG